MSWSEHFVWPAALWFLLVAPLAWGFAWWLHRGRVRRAHAFAGPAQVRRARSLRSSAGGYRKQPTSWPLDRHLAALGAALLAVAAAQPRFGASRGSFEPEPVDIVACLDVSRSMLARDVSSARGLDSRLARGHAELAALAARAQGDRLGLFAFAGTAAMLCPLTEDSVSFARIAASADPLAVSTGGTDLAAVLTASDAMLERRGGARAVVIVLTDGEDHGGRGLAAAQQLAARGVTVHCVGLGSEAGAKIPLTEGDDGTGGPQPQTFLRDREGREVITALNTTTLAPLAAAGGGRFVRAEGREPTTLVDLYDRHIAPIQRQAILRAERVQRPNRFQWPLLAGLLAWLFAWSGWPASPTRRGRPGDSRRRAGLDSTR